MKIEWKCCIKNYLQKSPKTIIDMITKWNLGGNSELWLTFEKMIFIPLFKVIFSSFFSSTWIVEIKVVVVKYRRKIEKPKPDACFLFAICRRHPRPKCPMFHLPLHEFLFTLNEIHPSLSFTMELEDNGKLPFLGMVIIRNDPRLDTKAYVKPTDTGLLLHYQSHADLIFAFKLSSNWQFSFIKILKWFLLACIILKPSYWNERYWKCVF